MPVTMKTRDGGSISSALKIIDQCSKRDQCGFQQFPERLPATLQILKFSGNAFTKLPPLPTTIRAIYGKDNRLSEFPDISHLASVETVDLSGNYIAEISDYNFPPSLKTLDLSDNIIKTFTVHTWPEELLELNLSVNRLVDIHSTFDSLNKTCKVSLDQNDFPCQKHNAYTLWIDPETESEAAIAEKFTHVARFLRFGIDIRVKNSTVAVTPEPDILYDHQPYLETTRTTIATIKRNQRRGNLRTIYDNSQNVHASSVQDSTNAAVGWLIENAKDKPATTMHNDSSSDTSAINPQHNGVPAWEHVIRAWRPRRFYHICKWLKTRRANRILRSYVQDTTIHSVHGLSYGQLVDLIWCAVKDHPHRYDILSVLQQEILEGQGLCFTGRFTRALNALSGFIEQVTVQISENEQMSNRIVQALRGLPEKEEEDSPSYQEKARKLVSEILREFNIPTGEWAIWLDAV
ncbi:hypothetical protein HDU87_001733 [Geranomyces variabilis]|uniref:Uncharacterized protein n=1 Tax=Geranomyces variabilis TaxID=109894 RepID=A0AAD5TCG3_9FUNG|nr:hypothetical protein HDU87_001733 [Geranomyces variabilis]